MKSDRGSAIVWLAIAALAVIGGLRLGVGALSRPGPGMFPLAAGVALAALALVLLVRTMRPPVAEKVPAPPAPPFEWRASLVIIGLAFGYAVLLEPLGFALDTLIFLMVLHRRDRSTWRVVTIWSVATTVALTILFRVLSVRLPTGFLGL
jgi:hypothetical protein